MKKLLIMSLVIAGLFFTGGCSTILNTTTQDIEIKSEPSSAKLMVDGKKYGITPQIINVERGSNHIIKIELDGHDAYETQLTRKISTWFWFNALNGILPGMVIDMFTGSMYNLLPEVIEVELQAAKEEPPAKKK